MEQEVKELHLSDFLTEEERNRINIHKVNTPFFDINENGRVFNQLSDEEKMNSNCKKPLEVGEQNLENVLKNIKNGEWDGSHIYFYKIDFFHPNKEFYALNHYVIRYVKIDSIEAIFS